MKYLIPALLLGLFGPPAQALTAADAQRLIAAFEQRCLTPLATGNPPDTSGLHSPSGANADSYRLDLTDDEVLMMFHTRRAGLYTCSMGHSVITAPIEAGAYSAIEAQLKTWLEAQQASGAFAHDRSCSPRENEWEGRALGRVEGRAKVFLSLYGSASLSYQYANLSVVETYGPPEPTCVEGTP